MPILSRRTILTALAAAPFGALSPGLRRRAEAQGLIAGSACLLQPETTAGPFYLDPGLVRADITEGRPGAAMTLRLQVVTADCTPIPGARVDVWHCDAGGIYSAFRSGLADARGQTFLRGTQMTGTDGVAAFRTIYPGWYPGRTPHVHYKVFLGDRTVLTSQLYFPAGASLQVYRGAAYRGRGRPDTSNAGDFLARRAGAAAVADLSGDTARLDAALVVGVRA
ncbi:MAG: intradiol ring-cleavage dioxygenase [Rhodobacter sp.]|nr:intradiol ring-cleavage dioxygenase [Rhodobacter sp.]